MQLRTSTVAASAATPVAAIVAVAGASGLCVLIAYGMSPKVALALPVACGILAAILFQPMVGVYLGVLGAPLEYLKLKVGSFAGLSLSEVLFLATAGSTVLHALLVRRSRVAPDPAHVAFLAFLCVVATGVVVAVDAYAVVKVVLMWSAFLTLSLLVSGASRAQLRGLLMAIAAAGGILGGMAIPNAHNIELVGGGAVAANRAAASFSSPNILAFFLVLALTPSLALALRSRGLIRVAMGVAGALIFGGLVLTLSRGAIIGATVSLAVMLLWPAFRRVAAVLLLIVVVGLVIDPQSITGSHEVSIVRTRLGTLRQERHTNPRLQIYRAAPTIVANHPILGIGEGNFPNTSAEYNLRDIGGDVFQHAHNLLLTILIETGLLGLAASLAFLATIARTMARALRGPWSESRALALGLVAALVGLFANSVTDYPLRANIIMAVVMLEIGALIAYGRFAAAGRDAS